MSAPTLIAAWLDGPSVKDPALIRREFKPRWTVPDQHVRGGFTVQGHWRRRGSSPRMRLSAHVPGLHGLVGVMSVRLGKDKAGQLVTHVEWEAGPRGIGMDLEGWEETVAAIRRLTGIAPSGRGFSEFDDAPETPSEDGNL